MAWFLVLEVDSVETPKRIVSESGLVRAAIPLTEIRTADTLCTEMVAWMVEARGVRYQPQMIPDRSWRSRRPLGRQRLPCGTASAGRAAIGNCGLCTHLDLRSAQLDQLQLEFDLMQSARFVLICHRWPGTRLLGCFLDNYSVQ